MRVNCFAAAVAASADESIDMVLKCGKNSNVRTILIALVCVTNTW